MPNNKFITLGPKILDKTLFTPPYKPNNCDTKPYGGLWACRLNVENQYNSAIKINNPWANYLYHSDEKDRKKLGEIENAVMFELKDTARILNIDSEETLSDILRKHPSQDDLKNFYAGELNGINYNSICRYYSGIFVDYDKLFTSGQSDIPAFKQWNFSSLLLFSLDAIKAYTGATFEYESEYKILSPLETFVTPDNGKAKVPGTPLHYQELLNYVYQILLAEINKKVYFADYDDYLSNAYNAARATLRLLFEGSYPQIDLILEYTKHEGITISREKIIENIVLTALAEYFKNNIEMEKTQIPRTRHRTQRNYWRPGESNLN